LDNNVKDIETKYNYCIILIIFFYNMLYYFIII